MNVREMYNYGYKWTGMIPLTAEEARNLFLNDSIQIYRLYQDNTESSVESLDFCAIFIWYREIEA